jgi:CDP-diacylglycerol pyrophosphatase
MSGKALAPFAGVIGFCALVVTFGLFVSIAAWPSRAAGPNALWHIVHDLCVPDMQAKSLPAPCTAVDLTQGYAVLKDLRGATQLLLIPTDRVSGIEDPKLLAASSPNYWQAAWSARGLFEQRVGRPVPRDAIALAVNSLYGRSQNQLHIHIDCVRADVRQALRRLRPPDSRWSSFNAALAGHRYRVMRLDGDDLAGRDPFKLLADGDPQARADMRRETLAVIGGASGFFLLSDRADWTRHDDAHGEVLMDHECRVLSRASQDRPRNPHIPPTRS